MNYSFMRRIDATPATSLTFFVDFTLLPTASEPMNRLDFPPRPPQSKQIFVQFISAWVTVAHRRTICSPKNIVWICEITHLKPRRAFEQPSIKRLADKHAVRAERSRPCPPVTPGSRATACLGIAGAAALSNLSTERLRCSGGPKACQRVYPQNYHRDDG